MSDTFMRMVETALEHAGNTSVELYNERAKSKRLAMYIYDISEAFDTWPSLLIELGYTNEEGVWIDYE